MSTPPCDAERRVEIGEEMRIGAGGQPAVVVLNPRSTIGKNEPSNDGESEACHLREVGRDLWSPRRDASVGTPDVRAEVHPVIDARPVCGPRVVAAVQEHQRRVTNGRILLRWCCLRAAEPRLSGRRDGRLRERYSPPVEYHLRERTLKSLFRARISIRRKPPAVPGSNAIRY